MLKALSYKLQQKYDFKHSNLIGQGEVEHTHGPFERAVPSVSPPPRPLGSKYPLLLAGLHACGDLSVTMFR